MLTFIKYWIRLSLSAGHWVDPGGILLCQCRSDQSASNGTTATYPANWVQWSITVWRQFSRIVTIPSPTIRGKETVQLLEQANIRGTSTGPNQTCRVCSKETVVPTSANDQEAMGGDNKKTMGKGNSCTTADTTIDNTSTTNNSTMAETSNTASIKGADANTKTNHPCPFPKNHSQTSTDRNNKPNSKRTC
jgi:hypothetical protein